MRRIVVLTVLVLLVGACSDSDEVVPPAGARTYFEALDLSTPTAAAETFLDAFARNDFLTVWLVLADVAQYDIENGIPLMRYGVVVDRGAIPDGEYERIASTLGIVAPSTWRFFDALMLAADEHDAFLIDLSGSVRITDEEVSGDGAVLTLEGTGIDGTASLYLSKRTGYWQVLAVSIGDLEEAEVVWPDRESWDR